MTLADGHDGHRQAHPDRHRRASVAAATGRGRASSASSRTTSSMLDELPQRLLIVGGGYIACEFACIFNGLGSRGDAVLPRRPDPARLRRRGARALAEQHATSRHRPALGTDIAAMRDGARTASGSRRPRRRRGHLRPGAVRHRPHAEHRATSGWRRPASSSAAAARSWSTMVSQTRRALDLCHRRRHRPDRS